MLVWRALTLDGTRRAGLEQGLISLAVEETAEGLAHAGLGFGNAGVHIPHANAYPVAGRVRDYRPEGYPQDEAMVPHAMAVTLTAPDTVFFSWDTALAPDVTVEPHVVFGPGVTVARGARIRSFSRARRFCHASPW